jgi:DNA-binding transcriptional ArsR family regulator
MDSGAKSTPRTAPNVLSRTDEVSARTRAHTPLRDRYRRQIVKRLHPGSRPIARRSLMRGLVSGNLRFVAAYQDADIWVALADRTRRSIVERLAHGPLAVGELARDLPVSRPAVSQHLKVLKRAGLVRDRAAGTRRVYQLDPSGLEALRADLDRFWMQALAGLKEIVERQEGDES